jgi:hypothetical protein
MEVLPARYALPSLPFKALTTKPVKTCGSAPHYSVIAGATECGCRIVLSQRVLLFYRRTLLFRTQLV